MLLAFATAPVGDPAPPALRWQAPSGCPTHDDVAASLAAQAATTDAPPTRLAADAAVRETAAGTWVVTITVASATDQIHRELELDSCAAAAEAVALIYGLALTGELDSAGDLDPTATEPTVPPPPIPVVPPPSGDAEPRGAVIVDAPEPVPSRTVRPPRGRPQLTIHLEGGGGVGTLPRGGGHAVLGVGAAWRRLRLGGRVDHAFVRRSGGPGDLGDLGVGVSSTTGGVEAAIALPLGPIELLPGLEVRAGALRARGIGGRRGDTRWVPWALVAGGVSLVWMAADAIGLRVGAAVEVPLVRHVFAFDDLEIARTRSVGGLFVAGVELRFLRGRR